MGIQGFNEDNIQNQENSIRHITTKETAKSMVSESNLPKIETRVAFEKQSNVKDTEKISERVTENLFYYYFLILLTIIIYVCIIILPFIVIRICYYRRCMSQ